MSAESAQLMPERSEQESAERRLKELGITLPAPPEPFGTYAEAVQTNNLVFLSGMLPTQGRGAAFIGRLGAELDVDTARKAARLAALNALAVARQHWGSLDNVTRIVRLGVMVATSGDVRDQPNTEDAVRLANETEYGLSAGVFGRDTHRALQVAMRIDCGSVHVNGSTVQNEAQAPYGGMKNSGYGRFDGRAVIDEFTELKWITVEPLKQQYPV